MVDLLDDPGGAGDGDFLAGRGWHHDGAKLGGVASDGILLVLLEHGVELERIGHALAGKPHDEATVLGALHVVDFDEVGEEGAEVLGAHAIEDREVKDALCKLGGRELTLACERGDGLVVEQTVGKAVEARRFHPAFLSIQLHEGNALEELPGDGLW